MTKFCKDCKHFKLPLIDAIFPTLRQFGKCTRNGPIPKPNSHAYYSYLVTGKTALQSMPFAGLEREFHCGEEAKYFEPKQ